MIKRMYSIRDLKAGTFGPVVFFDNDAVASRAFGDMILDNGKQSLVSQHPDDFALYYVGDFDLESAVFVTPPIVVVVSGSDIAKGVK